MGTVEIRRLEQSELELALPMWSQAFDKGERSMDEWREMEQRFGDRNVTYGLFDAAGLQATVLITDCKVSHGPDILIPLGGVSGVACLPAGRGKGYAGDAVRYVLERMKEAGQVTSALEPFSWRFYQNLGWDWTGVRRRYCVPSRVLRSDPETECVRAATPADRSRIVDLYTEFSGRYRGMLVRTASDWDHVLNDRKKEYAYSFLYEKDGRVEGYLVFYGWKEEETRIREFLTLTPRAQRALLGLLRRHEMQVKKFAWNAPENDLLWNQLVDWDLESKLVPLQMARIVDLPAALSFLRPPAEHNSRVNVAIRDANAPWNDGVWRISVEARHVEVRRTQEPAQVEMDIRQAAQAFFGSPTLDDLRLSDRLTVHDEAGYACLQTLFAGPPMWINDSF
jgi:predicted acetyltransferase